jgi:hypothetical protein
MFFENTDKNDYLCHFLTLFLWFWFYISPDISLELVRFPVIGLPVIWYKVTDLSSTQLVSRQGSQKKGNKGV